MYIADGNYRVRKVTVSSGRITTIAGNGDEGFSGDGGYATSATLTAPVGIAVDSSGIVYTNLVKSLLLIYHLLQGTYILLIIAASARSHHRRASSQRLRELIMTAHIQVMELMPLRLGWFMPEGLR